jgi:putative colanic acid biosynthesis UDP-glucose lipid carrier transferase
MRIQPAQHSLPAAVEVSSRVAFRSATRMSMGPGKLLTVLEMALEPLVLVASLWAVAFTVEGRLAGSHMLLAVVVFSLTFPCEARLPQPRGRVIVDIVSGWLVLAGLLALFGYVSGYLEDFNRETLFTWAWVAPGCQLAAHFALRAALPAVRSLQGAPKCALIAGMNPLGLELARRLKADVYSDVRIAGFIDDRAPSRLEVALYPLLGRIEELPELVSAIGSSWCTSRCR